MPCPIYSPKHFRRNTSKKGYRARYPFCVMINCRTRHNLSLQIPAIRFCASSEEIAVLPDAIPFPIPIADLLRRDFFQNRFVDLEQFAVLFQLHINALALERFPVTAGDLLRIHPQAHYGLAVVIARPAVDIQFQPDGGTGSGRCPESRIRCGKLKRRSPDSGRTPATDRCRIGRSSRSPRRSPD